MGALRIVSHDDRPFINRQEAGRLLVALLTDYAGAETIVLGIPRGGVVVAREIAHELGADLDVVLTRKLAAPHYPELAIGAVSEEGSYFWDEKRAAMVYADQAYLEKEKERQLKVLASRARQYRKILPRVSLKDRCVIVTDDGIATGSTMQSAISTVLTEGPRRLVVAVPVGVEENMRGMADQVDELVCLKAPACFRAVGQFYTDFDQTEDDEVLDILRQEQRRKAA